MEDGGWRKRCLLPSSIRHLPSAIFHPRFSSRRARVIIAADVHIPLTETLARVLADAQAEARRLNQDFIGTEHLALALLDQNDSEAGRILAQMNVQAPHVRKALAHALPAAKDPPVVTGKLPMSPRAQRLVTHAIVAAQTSRQSRISTRFLLAVL